MLAEWKNYDIPLSKIYKNAKSMGVTNPSKYKKELYHEKHGAILINAPLDKNHVRFRNSIFKQYINLRGSIYSDVKPKLQKVLTKGFNYFGNPDGSRISMSDLLQDFISFEDERFGEGITNKENDTSVRVIAGPKGSGKTLYLRRLQQILLENSSVYADTIQMELLSTELVIKFSRLFDENLLTERWMSIWRCSVLRSLTTHILYHPSLKEYVPSHLKKQFEILVPELSAFKIPVSIYSQAIDIIHKCNTAPQFIKYLDNPRWIEIEHTLGEILHDLPPLYFFCDSIDEEYAHSQQYWSRCQKGLFYHNMRLSRDKVFGGRLHIIISIRDHVLSSVFRSEHQTRFRNDPRIFLLDWSYESIKHFLIKKIEDLPDSVLIDTSLIKNDPLKCWLGHNTIFNPYTKTKETLDHFFQRHIRTSPRDIIILGNSLCTESNRAKLQGLRSVPIGVIKDRVLQVAKVIGTEQIAICGNHIASHGLTSSVTRGKNSNIEFIRSFDDRIRRFIRSVGKFKFTFAELMAVAPIAQELFGMDADFIFSMLWRNGLIGYRKKDAPPYDHNFYSMNLIDDLYLPQNHTEYIFHPSVAYAVGVSENS